MSLSQNQPQPRSALSYPAGIAACDSFLTAIAQLPASAEPTAVLSSLAALCVPAFCDECTIGLDQEGQPAQWIRYPAVDGGSASSTLAQRDGSRKVSAYFEIGAGGDSAPRCAGVVTYTWHQVTPSAADRVFARLLTDRVAAIVEQQRRIAAAELAARAIENLKAGLASNRRVALAIGILMATHKVTEPDAFAMLSRASQRAHRKVRDIADEVVLTGEIQPPPRGRQTRVERCTKG